MSNPRYKRLMAEHKKVLALAQRSMFVYLLETSGRPPEKYLIRLNCAGISHIDRRGKPIITRNHLLKVYLPPEFPRRGPLFELDTPIWHPNIGTNGAVCIGDKDHGYSPSMGLDDLLVRVIEIIRYENYNPGSPLNSLAASWARQNRRLFPLEKEQILMEEINIIIKPIQLVDQDIIDMIKINH